MNYLLSLLPEHGDEQFVVRSIVLGMLSLCAEAIVVVSVWGH